jgi:glutathione S-transferase
MQLWSGTLSTFSTKVRIACGEKGIAVTIRELPWSRQSSFAKSAEFMALSPRGEVPVLVDGDLVLYDSTVINEYLEEKYPEPRLLPRTPVSRARCRLLEDQADWLITTHVTTLIREVFMQPDASARDSAALGRAHAAITNHHGALDQTLAGKPYLCGDLSLADIGTFVALAFSRTLGVPIDPDHAHLSAWYLRVGTRIVVKKEFDAIRRAAAQA